MLRPGQPPPGMPVVTWSRRGLETGAEELPPDLGEKLVGALSLGLWRILGALALPLLLLHPRARRHILDLPAPEPGWTWLHGASVGENVAARALAPCLDGPVWRTSSSWRSRVAGAFPAPLDLPWVFEAWLRRARPARLVLVEGELWPGWLAACRAQGIPIAVVNARPGRRSARWRRFPRLWRWLSRGLRFIPQSETGDLKLCAELGAATFQLGRDAFIGASTRPGDEARLLAAWSLIPPTVGRRPRPLLVLAPRHLDRLPELLPLLEQSGLSWCRRTERIDPAADVLLLDTLGELSGLYSQARAAFIGGTFDPEIGGHSPAEPFSAGLPVVHGPHTQANPTAWTQGIAVKVDDADPSTIPERLARAIRSALSVGPSAAAPNEAALRCAAMLPPGRLPPALPARPWLWPLAPLWRLAVALDQRRSPEQAPLPVISLGALSAGGSGKTPAVAWLAAQLPGAWVLGRGYRRRGPGPELRLGLPDQPPEHDLGDELEMLRRRGLPVISCPDRLQGAAEAARRGARILLLDDGFQHRALRRDIDVVCIDGRWPQGRGPIPVGEEREGPQALERAHFLWLHHARSPAASAFQTERPLIRSHLAPQDWLIAGQPAPLSAVQGEVDVVVGIARPEGFLCALVQLGLVVRSLRLLADHAPLGELPAQAVMTEKDAARLPPGAPVRALRMRLVVEGAEALVAEARRRAGP